MLCGMIVVPAFGQLAESRVLVLYNSANADSLAVWRHYSQARPGVRGLDLNDPALLPGTISYENFRTRIRQPLRNHLSTKGLTQEVVVFVLTMGIPHRIQDLRAGDVGDNPGAVSARFNAGNASFASVDSELTLLWQNLDNGEADGMMDSAADNQVLNPYYGVAASIAGYDRSKIAAAKSFSATGVRWKMLEKSGGSESSPGNLYLTARLDGNSAEAVKGMIDRGLHPVYDPSKDHLIEDKSAGGTYESSDYQTAFTQISPAWPAFTFEQTDAFLIGLNGDLPAGNDGCTRFTGWVAALTGYGGNHSGGSKDRYVFTYTGQLVPGAIYNAYESYNARKFGGIGGFDDHAQLSDWVDAGGTFGTGHVWEPFTSSVARNAYLLKNYLQGGRTWVESAWSGIRYLSWQNVVLGDPLAVASFGTREPAAGPVVSVTADGRLSERTPEIATAVVTLSEPVSRETRVKITLAGDARAGEDFAVIDGGTEVVVPPFQTRAEIRLEGLTDDEAEGTEQVEMSVQAAAGYVASAGAVEVPIEDSQLGSWLVSRFGQRAEATGDPDGDGLCNLLEFAMGLDPEHADDPGAPRLTREAGEDPGEIVWLYRFTRDPSVTEIGCQVEVSEDLRTWQPQVSTRKSGDDGKEWMEVRVSTGDHAARFFRMTATPAGGKSFPAAP